MNRNRYASILGAGLIIALGGGLLYVRLRSNPPASQTPTPESAETASAQHVVVARMPVEVQETPEKRTPSAAALQAREKLLSAITAAREERSRNLALAGKPAERAMLDNTTPAGKEDIRKQVTETLIPLVRECYQEVLNHNPTLEGKIILRFTVSGEPELGGLVETASVDEEQSTIKDSSMIECARENSYALRFPPPRNGGSVNVELPIIFRSVEDNKQDPAQNRPANK